MTELVASPDAKSRTRARSSQTPQPGVAWLSDLIRLEIALWDRIDARLRADHGVPLAHFETLWFLARSPDGVLRVGELANALRVTVGGTSKIAQRLVAARLITRRPDPQDGRASRLALTVKGRRLAVAAEATYETELRDALASLTVTQQDELHHLIRRLLRSQAGPTADEAAGSPAG